jgi:hypothetical protein
MDQEQRQSSTDSEKLDPRDHRNDAAAALDYMRSMGHGKGTVDSFVGWVTERGMAAHRVDAAPTVEIEPEKGETFDEFEERLMRTAEEMS